MSLPTKSIVHNDHPNNPQKQKIKITGTKNQKLHPPDKLPSNSTYRKIPLSIPQPKNKNPKQHQQAQNETSIIQRSRIPRFPKCLLFAINSSPIQTPYDDDDDNKSNNSPDNFENKQSRKQNTEITTVARMLLLAPHLHSSESIKRPSKFSLNSSQTKYTIKQENPKKQNKTKHSESCSSSH